MHEQRERDKDGSHHANCVPTFTSDYFLQAVEPIKWNGGTGGMCLSVTEDGDRQSETDLKHKQLHVQKGASKAVHMLTLTV